MGILANHVPSIEAVRPGVVEVIEGTGASKKFFGTWLVFVVFFEAGFN
jgi:F0F1-type ATP synthase epsilon subunit